MHANKIHLKGKPYYLYNKYLLTLVFVGDYIALKLYVWCLAGLLQG